LLDLSTIEAIKSLLISNFQVDKIILFGSQARGIADKRSDVDLLIIGNYQKERIKTMRLMRKILLPIDYAFDIITLTQEEFERDKNYPGTIARYASKEGVVLYEHK